jgi:hypothetical protein
METTREELCKEFTKLTGGQWHDPDTERNFYHHYMCSCGKEYGDFDHLISHCIDENPTYENPADILKVMMERHDHKMFCRKIGVIYDDGEFMIRSDFITEPDALLKATIEFLR